MDSYTVWKIIGIAATGVFAYWRIRHARKLKDKIQLTLVNHTLFPLLATFQNRFKTINLEFTLPVNTNVFYYKASIINSGNLDIDKTRIHKAFEITFPEGCNILECKIVRVSSQKVSLENKFESNRLLIEWDLIKPNENFTFELIIDSPIINNHYEMEESIQLDHRITDLRTINKINESDVGEATISKLLRENFIGLLVVFMMIIGTGFAIYQIVKPYFNPALDLDYQLMHKGNGKNINLSLMNDSMVLIKDNSGWKEMVNVKNVKEVIHLEPKVDVEKIVHWHLLIALFVFCGAFYLTYGVVSPLFKEIKKIKVINSII